jgi:hypothetical protein
MHGCVHGCLYWVVLPFKVFLQLAREEQAAAHVAGLADDGLYSTFGVQTEQLKLLIYWLDCYNETHSRYPK